MISKALTRISSNYLDAKSGSMKDSSLAPFINKVSKEIIKPNIKKIRSILNTGVVVGNIQTGQTFHG